MSKSVIFGVGNAGCRTLNHILDSGQWKKITFFAVDTDRESLNSSKAHHKVFLSGKLRRHSGINGNSKVVRCAARQSMRDIDRYLVGVDTAFVVAGMGGVTGTGFAPVLAETAREMGILTVGIAFLPFRLEGQRRLKVAHIGVENFKRSVDSMFVVDNEELLKLVDEVPRQAIQGITDLIGQNFDEVRSALTGAGSTVMGIGFENGKERVEAAVQAAVNYPLDVPLELEAASRVIVNITTGPGVKYDEVEHTMNTVSEKMKTDAKLVFGHIIDENVGDSVKVTLFSAFPNGYIMI